MPAHRERESGDSGTVRSLRCCVCQSVFKPDSFAATAIRCASCEHEYKVIRGVPILLQEHKQEARLGFAETSFRSPKVYETFVRIKSKLYRDSKIGVEEYVANADLLDVGCGPTLRSDYREYVPENAASVTGVDISVPFVLAARETHPESRYFFAAASVDNLPFPDKSFDTSILSFVIHHVRGNAASIMSEVARVTRKHIIVYDHLREANPLIGAVQMTYWRLADGGCNYMRRSQWERCLKGFTVEKELRTGAIFGHVLKFIVRVSQP
jgi:SAM-dependent methyltransferase